MSPILYVFIHIPKTAGSTIRHHIARNYRPDEVIWVYREIYFRNTRTGEKRILGTHDEMPKCFDSLTDDEKDKLRIIFGHAAYYGIHEFLDRTPRYLTVVRSPVSRVLSHYNYLLTRRASGTLAEGELKEVQSPSGEVIPFEIWLDQNRYMQDYVTKLLTTRYWLSDSGLVNEASLSELKRVLKNFYFVGTTKAADILFLYYLLEIETFFRDQNVSVRHFWPADYKETRGFVRSRNELDVELYKYCLRLNREFKRTHKAFYLITAYMFIKRGKAPVARLINAVRRHGVRGSFRTGRERIFKD